MDRKSKLGITLCSILLSLSLGTLGCAIPQEERTLLKEERNITGLIPYILTGFDKKYVPKAEDRGKGNMLRYKF